MPIEVYEEAGVYKIIDGRQAWQAYRELGVEPKSVRVLTFKDDAEEIAYSRHKNINRLQQTPVTYTKSVFQELKLRLEVETDDEVKRILRRVYNVKYHSDRYNLSEEDNKNVLVIEDVFRSEPKDWKSFTTDNLVYLDFPLWLAEMVDRAFLSLFERVLHIFHRVHPTPLKPMLLVRSLQNHHG